ncbi:hypothetical protein ACKI16_29340 [Streptomyces scabiei]|uniref:hypothetical protein n=1 Tax=Streptomyces scabiei TaxID=1930 RepID=UPI0038F61716
MAVAGCGTHRAVIVDRDGAQITAAEVLTYVEWTRALDDTSTARVTINPEGNCCERLANVRSWRHSLLIFRDNVAVWQGPIIQIEWGFGQVEISASDISAWLARRVPHESRSFTDTDLTEIATWLIDDGFRPDDPGHQVETVAPARVRGGRAYTVNEGQTVDHLFDLAETGLDWTIIGSKFVLLPEDWSAAVGRLTEADMPEGLKVTEDGASLATRWVVAGEEGGDLIGEAGGKDDYYGLLERYVEQTSITTAAASTDAAKAKLRTSRQAPVFIDTQEVTISPQAAVNIPDLVPGWCLDVTTIRTCRKVSQRLKITGLKVVEDAGSGDSPGAESVQVQVSALAEAVNA